MSIRSSAASLSSIRTRWSRSRSRPTSLPKLAAGTILATLLLAAPAAASSAIYCDGQDISAHIGAGRLVVLSVLGARIATAERAYSTGPDQGEGEPFIAGQSFWDDEQVLIDFTDPNVEKILVSVRLRYVEGDDEWPLAGTITFEGTAHSVRCGLG